MNLRGGKSHLSHFGRFAATVGYLRSLVTALGGSRRFAQNFEAAEAPPRDNFSRRGAFQRPRRQGIRSRRREELTRSAGLFCAMKGFNTEDADALRALRVKVLTHRGHGESPASTCYRAAHPFILRTI